MPKITITANDGEIRDTFDVHDYDLDKPIMRAALLDEVLEALKRAAEYERLERLERERLAKKRWSEERSAKVDLATQLLAEAPPSSAANFPPDHQRGRGMLFWEAEAGEG